MPLSWCPVFYIIILSYHPILTLLTYNPAMNNSIPQYAVFPKGNSHTYKLCQQSRIIGQFSAMCAYFRSIMYPQPLGIYSLPDDVLPCLDTRGAICSLPMHQVAVMNSPSITPGSSAWKMYKKYQRTRPLSLKRPLYDIMRLNSNLCFFFLQTHMSYRS